jgi:hypothetical protein
MSHFQIVIAHSRKFRQINPACRDEPLREFADISVSAKPSLRRSLATRELHDAINPEFGHWIKGYSSRAVPEKRAFQPSHVITPVRYDY